MFKEEEEKKKQKEWGTENLFTEFPKPFFKTKLFSGSSGRHRKSFNWETGIPFGKLNTFQK